MDKRFWGFLIIIVAVLGGIYWASTGNKTSPTSSQPTQHIEGQGKDNVTLIEYGDYQCPYCGEYSSVINQVINDYSPYIKFQFRNLPLTQLHQNAFAGARAAEAAGLMGQFWQMHDLLYTQNVAYYGSNETLANWVNSSTPETYFDQYAQQLGLNVNKFNQYYASAQVNNLINADTVAFAKTGAQEATPTFFLDGTQIQPSIGVASFETLINAEIKKKGFTLPTISSSASTSSSPAAQSVQPSTSSSTR